MMMLRLFFLLLVIAGLSLFAAWVADHPGTVTVYWFDWRIDTSAAFLLTIGVIAAILLATVTRLLQKIWLAPWKMSERRSLAQYEKGLTELTYSVAALATADTKTAEQHTKKAQKLLGNSPITVLLQAQIARSQGDDTKTRALLEQLLEHPETEYLAARLLSDAAYKQQLFPKALSLAERARAVNPKDAAATNAIVSLHIKLGQWQEALHAIHKAGRKSFLKRGDMLRSQGLVHLKQGRELLANHYTEEALSHARLCQKLLPDFAPALVFTARAYAAHKEHAKALRLLIAAMKHTPHPDLSAGFHAILSEMPKDSHHKWVKKLPASSAVDERQWQCNACGHTTAQWDTHCAACDAFDTLTWK